MNLVAPATPTLSCVALFNTRGQKAVQMELNSKIIGPAEQNSPWPGIVKFLMLAVLIAIIFLLGQDMVRHRFFRGGWVNQRDVLKP
jgi:hypothetical protein